MIMRFFSILWLLVIGLLFTSEDIFAAYQRVDSGIDSNSQAAINCREGGKIWENGQCVRPELSTDETNGVTSPQTENVNDLLGRGSDNDTDQPIDDDDNTQEVPDPVDPEEQNQSPSTTTNNSSTPPPTPVGGSTTSPQGSSTTQPGGTSGNSTAATQPAGGEATTAAPKLKPLKGFSLMKALEKSGSKAKPQYLAMESSDDDAIGDVNKLLQRIANGLAGLAAAVAVFFVVINGMKLTFSVGDTEEVTKAKKGLTWAAAGLILIAFSFVIAKTVIKIAYLGEDIEGGSSAASSAPAGSGSGSNNSSSSNSSSNSNTGNINSPNSASGSSTTNSAQISNTSGEETTTPEPTSADEDGYVDPNLDGDDDPSTDITEEEEAQQVDDREARSQRSCGSYADFRSEQNIEAAKEPFDANKMESLRIKGLECDGEWE